MMKIAYHGGKCCAIKVIHGLPVGDYAQSEIHASPGIRYYDRHRMGGKTDTDMNLFVGDAPKEKSTERFERYVEYMKEKQAAGLLEVVVHHAVYAYDKELKPISQYSFWKPVLEANGFKEIVTFTNSNSSQDVTVFHLVYGEANKGKA